MTVALSCGGDTDTVGAILGALLGATLGKAGIPPDWSGSMCEWPRSLSFMHRLASKLTEQKESPSPLGSVHYFWPGLVFRNLFFLIVVLIHGFRRLFDTEMQVRARINSSQNS
jgi:ADP-ribosyl-[dinitrogen reductase] hydrolase